MTHDDIYRQLQRHLDRMPVPYPATKSGVEIRILQRLFTPEEARIAVHLSAIPEPVGTIHRRVRREMDVAELHEALGRMASKGLIQRLPGKDGPRFSKSPLVVGMYEAQVDRLTPELERDVRAYIDEGFGDAMQTARTPQMRTVPVNKAISAERAIASYDDIRKFVEASPGPFAAQSCVCRQGKELTGEPCRQTSNPRNCLLFGVAAAMMTKKGVAREVTKKEMLVLLDQADRDGLVLEPQNTREPLFVCCCCGCCCGVLTTAKKRPRPADFFQTDFVARVETDACEVCGVCAQRCQMDAVTFDDGPAKVAEERCIGCGLCVTTCESGAMRLHQKDGRRAPPKDTKALYVTMFQDRYGRLGAAAAMAGHFLGRKF